MYLNKNRQRQHKSQGGTSHFVGFVVVPHRCGPAAGDAPAQEEVHPRVRSAAAYTQQQRVNMDAVGTTINMPA